VVQLLSNVFLSKIPFFVLFLWTSAEKVSILTEYIAGGVSPCNTHTHTHTRTFRQFTSISTSPCMWTHSSSYSPLIPYIPKPPVQSTSPQFSYSCCCMMFILLSSIHFSFHSFKSDILCLSVTIRSHVHVCAVPGGSRD
jgi:hypothetical protein